MAVMDVSRQRKSLLDDATALKQLPAELLELIRDTTAPKLLDAISEAALIPPLTERIFVHFESAFADVCARWILNSGNGPRVLRSASALARILPFAPYLSTFLEQPTTDPATSGRAPHLHLPLPHPATALEQTDDQGLLEYLITIWRLMSFDLGRFGRHISPAFTQDLFEHRSRPVRYVAIRIFCQLLHASDHKLETLVNRHIGKEEAISGDLDGISIDFEFLTLHENARAKNVIALRQKARDASIDSVEPTLMQNLTPYVVPYGAALVPRPLGPTGDPSSLVQTETTTRNLENLARMLQTDSPILLHGLPGSGKTSLVHEIAQQLGMYSSMVTLHLNEQTDAKMLVGLYSTDSQPGSFQWRPGVLTTAVKEGRWVLVEDLDRAPTEVLSTLLPLIERNELLIASRGERIKAASTFRLFATVRNSRGLNGRENLPSIVGMRFWQSVHTEPLSELELEEVVLKAYPMLRKFAPGILAVYKRLSALGRSPQSSVAARSLVDRQVNLRDLLKWCRRLRECLSTAGSLTGDEPISETTRDWMFMEALDCFVGSSPNAETSKKLVYAIAEEMHLSTERADHYVRAYIPPLEENDSRFEIGRVRLQKQRISNRVQKSKRPFASTAHAKKLLEQIAQAVKLSEPVLLVGETGIGKTTVVQQLADSLGHKLVAVNLSQQSEVGDLLGGFKPVNVRTLAVPLKEEFEDLFVATGISASKNQKYFEQVGKFFAKGQWSRVSKLWKEAPKMFLKIVDELERAESQSEDQPRDGDVQPAKRRKTQSKLQMLLDLRPRWDAFSRKLEQFDVQISGGGNSFAFTFIEGNIVKAVRNGDWVLLDEINLASPDTLESIGDLLTGPAERPSILLSETGEIEKIVAHPNFRIFGAMNPATDIGKRDLPMGIRSRFTELFVHSPDTDIKDLLTIIRTYLGTSSSKHDQAADDIARLYLNTKRMAEEKRLVDGANEVPHFSLRTLTRVLGYVNNIGPLYGLRRALYEGFSMGFLTLLNRESEQLLVPLIHHHLFDKQGNLQSLLSQAPKRPNDGRQYVKFMNKNRDRQYWILQGTEPILEREDYIITPYVERNVLNLVRATSTRRFPILIQGPTSAGKTSMIEYLANYTGNKFVRINNHEHTDLQEYLGTYVSGPDGKLHFQEGLLVQAMRQGHWIVLDELNLAPTDVLEALNRLLDDNRELLIPETQEVVRPHENFILFATQNPPGLYGGRKVLSRAFRNRFLELHFDDIPEDELEFILQHRSRNTSPPDCRRIVAVYKDLSRLRQTSRLFEQKDSFATLRDLFRWALREAETREEIAAHGFMLLAERVRNEEERLAVKDVIEKVFKVKVDPAQLYSPDSAPELRGLSRQENSHGVVWTHSMRRLYVLVSRALRNNEPVLLVGETGCGKTTVCQLLAEALGKQLHIVNAHQNTETGDLIGSQRPIRNRGAILDALNADLGAALHALNAGVDGPVDERLARFKSFDQEALSSVPGDILERIASNEIRSKALFEWSDGALVEAMKKGHLFLLDEISLADDSVLERLNSVLEPQRTLLLAEKGIDNSLVIASSGFQLFATMNPGGDFGKKELSPALRNRFTEIWVPPLSESEDIYDIVRTKLVDGCEDLVDVIIQFASWFGETFRSTSSTKFSVREILVWVEFVNTFHAKGIVSALVHGASTIFIDGIGANPSAIIAGGGESIAEQRSKCLRKLGDLAGQDVAGIYGMEPLLAMDDKWLSIGDFSIPRVSSGSDDPGFALHAPTTRRNGMRVLRALQMRKPILLEGSPGVGKTTLVAALARASGHPLTRINLSDQTDLMDLFGTDIPVEGAEAGNFAWRDAPFLQAMQKGEWVLLDEMNLASQSVLEGLNACLDHRGEVYISELDQVFKRHPDFRLFAAQNPHHQGGGRKGLPSSFVNRFVVVYADVFTTEDLQLIAAHNFPEMSPEVISQLIQFISHLEKALVTERSLGSQGGPWEFNLRDVLRWLHLLNSREDLLQNARIDDFLDLIVRQRFRTSTDRDEVNRIFAQTTGTEPRSHSLYHDTNALFGQVGLGLLHRNPDLQPQRLPRIKAKSRLPEIETLMICVKKAIPCILSSPSGHGKSVLLEYVAALSGKPLVVFPMNADIDTMDLVGGFEQADPLREVNAMFMDLQETLQQSIMSIMPGQVPTRALQLLHLLEGFEGNTANIDPIRNSIQSLSDTIPRGSEVGKLLTSALELLSGPLTLDNPRFEWLDGVIVKALLTGQWLVLDNANMCNASVLDRLNSLLEPDGFLSINEHCEPGGEPRIIKPHPDFRIFLTVDPRYGELSRAMRNRAVEIYLQSPPPTIDPSFTRIAQVESRLQRFMTVEMALESTSPLVSQGDVIDASSGVLSLDDLRLVERYVDDVQDRHGDQEGLLGRMSQLFEFLKSSVGSDNVRAIADAYAQLPMLLSPSMAHKQPIHTLVNILATHLIPNSQTAEWLGVRYDFSLSLHHLHTLMEGCRRKAQGRKISSLSRLERSLMKDQVATVSKDTTVNLSSFIISVASMILEYLSQGPSSPPSWKDVSGLLLFLMRYLRRTILLSSGDTFDEARFQAHLAHGGAMLQGRLERFPGAKENLLLSCTADQIKRDFATGFKLSSGLSMELLWKIWRPTPFRDEGVLRAAVELEQLAARFDALRWRTSTSIKDLCNASTTLEKAYKLVKTTDLSTEDLVKSLTSEIKSLEGRIGIDSPETRPFFSDDFDRLRQLAFLREISVGNSSDSVARELLLLSDVPTQTSMALADTDERSTSTHLQHASALVCRDRFTWDGKLAPSLWAKLQGLGLIDLNSLALLETELPILGQHLTSLAPEIVSNPLPKLNGLLWNLLLQVFEVHGSHLRSIAIKFYAEATDLASQSSGSMAGLPSLPSFGLLLDNIEAEHFRDTTRAHFIPAIGSMAASRFVPGQLPYFSALAWSHFSIGTVLLYVPDRLFDPQIRPQMEREFFEDMQSHLKEKMRALQHFEQRFTGQDTNSRIELLQDQISQLGPLPPSVQPVFRPEKSELGRLHAEFSNILKAVESVDLPTGHGSLAANYSPDSDKLRLVKDNVQRLIERLSSRFDAYQDMTLPTTGLLRCLLIGLSLCDAISCDRVSASSAEFLEVTPFFGGLCRNPKISASSARSFEYLDLMGLLVSIRGIESLDREHRQSVFECFHSFYDDWTKRLEVERKAEEAKTSLYRFRGSAEDEEQVDADEFNELFPGYENEALTSSVTKKKDQVREVSLKAAQSHRKLFLSPSEPSEAISDLCRSVGRRVADEAEQKTYCDPSLNHKMLSGVLLMANEANEKLSAPGVGSSYNFYVDGNLCEARQLASLANKIKGRFRELQRVDEIGHMQPLEDVVQSCDKLLEVVHTDPLAVIIPKVEHLHAHVYEWQFGGWASRVHSVLDLHNALTDTIIRWRRLELSTWGRLFDMEKKKCEDDAYSWWFVAYQVVVATPLSMVESASELEGYAVSLIETLEVYFATSIVGQFSSRLGLLRQLRNHLGLLLKDYPTLSIIHCAVVNFIDYYSRYESPSVEAIQKGRVPIDKKMKDVLLMASWRDTNINALRESARKSHEKLFRLVRKFRGVLGQEMKAIIDQGLPDESTAQPGEEHEGSDSHLTVPTPGDGLSEVLPSWLEQNRRLANAPKTVSVMKKLALGPELGTDVPSTIDDFVSSLNASVAELRKETPAFLSDDNKEQVKHLKTRKRKLFADTLKELRHMGVRHNLSQDRLAEQDSIAITLATMSPVLDASSTMSAAQYYLHKTISLAPTARLATREHSEELTSAEVIRSVGFVEGLIHMLLSQRKRLGAATNSLSLLQKSLNRFRLVGGSNDSKCLAQRSSCSQWDQLLPWLVQVLYFAGHLVGVHSRLGVADHSNTVQLLESWGLRLREQHSKWCNLGTLPGSVTSTDHVELASLISNDLRNLQDDLHRMAQDEPNLAFILNEVQLWSKPENVTFDATPADVNFKEFADMVSKLCDTVLVAAEAAKKAGLDVPSSGESAGWLALHDDAFSSLVRQLHMTDITKNVNDSLEALGRVNVDHPGASLAITGVASLMTPILEQFVAMCSQSVHRLLDIHRATAHMAFFLTKTFTQMASQGFCTPQEKSDESSGDSGKIEGGTGLGDGEGAQDISKDVEQDEDLSDLAQEPNKEKREEMEDEQDAVDMADEEMEGDLASVDGKDEEDSQKGDDEEEEEEEKDMDEEAGEVDDLDPTAVDEKMWDGKDEEDAEKDQQGDKSKGEQKDDEQMAAEGGSKEENDEKDEQKDQKDQDNEQGSETDPEEAGAEEEDAKAQDEMERQEQTAQENDALALPDDMDLDLDDDEAISSDSDGLDALSDADDQEQQNEADEVDQNEDEADAESDSGPPQNETEPETNGADDDDEGDEQPEDDTAVGQDDEVQDDVKSEDQGEPESAKDEAPRPQDNAVTDKDNTAPSDVKSSGKDQSGEAMDLDEEFQDSAAQQEDGEMGQGAADQDAAAGNKGSTSKNNNAQENEDMGEDEEAAEAAQSDPFKKLGDALEKWHRQQSDIKEANREDGSDEQHQQPDADQSRREFQHLQNDDAAADAQAMGTADDEEAQPMDESMAIDDEKKEDPNSRLMDQDKDETVDEAPDQKQPAEPAEPKDKKAEEKDEGRSGVQTRQGNYNRDQTPPEEDVRVGDEDKDDVTDESVEETSTQLSAAHISQVEREPRDFGECMQQWVDFQSKTHGLSLSLTSQLRLILTPSQSTKLSGSFRTGKRLNIKRIIPYIASSYKRDKIWMRRAIPTKRTYQILLCVDDSRSMGESSSGTLALESLVMVSRSLAMLEAGQVGVVGFGADVFTAHDLAEPFAAEAGAKALQQFRFSQDRTDIALLVRQTIDRFRAARQQQSGSSDLWQLALIMSDGLTPSSAHDEIRRLLREAAEERIMVVFIIMDDTGQRKGDSVLELKEAKFVSQGGESRVVIERYLDTFPFQYYLIVHNLEDLPSALAGLLRTWFAEVSS